MISIYVMYLFSHNSHKGKDKFGIKMIEVKRMYVYRLHNRKKKIISNYKKTKGQIFVILIRAIAVVVRQKFISGKCGNARRGRPRKIYPDLISEVLQKGRVRCTRNRRACMTRCLNVDEVKGVSKDLSKWLLWFSAYPHGKKAWVYVCMYLII